MRIKIIQEYNQGFWANSRIGQEFDAVVGKHPCYPSIPVYFIGNTKSFFIPAKCCIVVGQYKKEHPSIEKRPIIVTNFKTDLVIRYDSLTEAAHALRMAKSSLHNSIEKGLLINNVYFADYDLLGS